MQSTLRVNTIRHTREALIPKIEQYIHETYGQDGSDMFKVSAHSALHDLIVITNSGPHPAERKYQEVAVDVRCGEALLRGADLFAVGVMAADALIQAE